MAEEAEEAIGADWAMRADGLFRSQDENFLICKTKASTPVNNRGVRRTCISTSSVRE